MTGAGASAPPGPLSLRRVLQGAQPGIIAVYGSGGKTALLERLAREITAHGGAVVLATTTRIYPPAGAGLLLGQDPRELEAALRRELERAGVAALGSALLPEGKVAGVDPGAIERLRVSFPGTFFLVEADGAAGRPLKGHASHEPVIPFSTNLALPVLGLSALGSPAGPETAHRGEILFPSIGASPGEPLAAEHLARAMLLLVRRGLEQAPGANFVPVFNQADHMAGSEAVFLPAAAAALAGCPGVERFICTALREEPPVRFVLEQEGQAGGFAPQAGGVILAAGLSERMGRDKLALPFRGKTVLEHAVESAAAAGLREVVVVVRPGSPWPEKLASRTGVRVVINPCCREGIASSLRAGLAAAAGGQAVVFALGDQPLVSPAVYRAILRAYRENLSAVVYPACRGRRGNPVLFDRRTWPLLLELTGDAGGRQILPQLNPAEITTVELDDPSILQDLDTPADFHSLLNHD